MSSNASNNLLPSLNQSKISKNIAQSALSGLGSLLRHLPVGPVFFCAFLSPVLTNNGDCHPVHKYLSIILIAICGLSSCLASFTDSYMDNQGNVHYGIATRPTTKGLWPGSPGEDLSRYRLQVGDFVRAFLTLCVFAVVVLLSPDIVDCFYPDFKSTQRALLMALPPVVGAILSTVFVMFPNARRGIGYLSSEISSLSSTVA